MEKKIKKNIRWTLVVYDVIVPCPFYRTHKKRCEFALIVGYYINQKNEIASICPIKRAQ